MKKIFSLVWFLFYLQSAFAQEQITDFENVAIKSPQSVQFIDTLNGKIVFFVYQPEQRQQQSLWSSDGTAASTKILKDEFGESVSPSYGETAKIKNYRYLKGQHIWRTDGEKLERIVSNSDSLYSLQEFNKKPLLIFGRNETIGNQGFNFLTFTWLDSLNKVNIFDRDIVYYQIIDSTLHYIKLNKQTKFFELHNLSGDKYYKSVIPISQTVFNIYSFEIFTQKDVDFYFLNTSQGKKLFSKKRNDSTDVSFLSLIDWGSNQYNFPWVLKDEFKKTYFANYNSSINNLKIYALTEQNTLVEQWSIQTLLFFPDNNLYYGQGFQVRNMSIIDDKIIFNSTTGSEGINAYYFNVFDIKKNTNRKSRNLGADFGNKFYSMNVTQKDSNTYELDNKIGLIATYNFLVDSVTNIRTYPYRNIYSADSIFTVNQQKILLSGNIYNISNATKIPLIAERGIFDANSSPLTYKIFGNKLLFLKYNNQLQKTELWVSNGEKNGSELLIFLEGYFYNNNFDDPIKVLGNKMYFYTNDNQNGLLIYETDGTKAGTSRIFRSDGTYSVTVDWVKSNEKQIVYKIFNSAIIVVEDSKGTLINNIPQTISGFDILLTSNQVFLVTNSIKNVIGYPYSLSYQEVFKVNKNGLILMGKGVDVFYIHKDRLFYTKRNFPENNNGTITFKYGSTGIYFLNELDKVNIVIDELIEEFGVFNNKLVYRQSVAEGLAPKHTIIDLPTNKVDLIFNDFYSYGMQSINGTLMLFNDVKWLIIKDKQKREFERFDLLEPLGKGILMGDSKNLNYYDILKNTVNPILTDKQYERPLIGKNATYILVPERVNDSTTSYSYWDLFNKKLIGLNYTGNFFQLDSMQALSSKKIRNDYVHSYWRFDGNNFFRSYELPQYINYQKSNTDNYYGTIYTKETGNELIQLGAESIITYPEIVKGSEGIMLGSAFHFNNQRYVYAFTYTYGWQVWKMGEGDKGTPLSKEEENENLISVFPNPVQDLLNIESQQSYHYRVINNNGQEMMKGNIEPQQTINFKNLATGLYIIQFSDGQKIFSKKVIKF